MSAFVIPRQESGTLLDPTVVVKAVRGRGAIAAGVQVGDEILAIGQTPVVDLLSMREGLSALGDPRRGNPPLALKLRRAGRRIEVAIFQMKAKPLCCRALQPLHEALAHSSGHSGLTKLPKLPKNAKAEQFLPPLCMPPPCR
eukprot:s1915_g4.t1